MDEETAVAAPLERRVRPWVLSRAADDVIAERVRQTESEGWTAEHDDEHEGGELAEAAACYALGTATSDTWPGSWDQAWWKPRDRRRNLVRAAALLIAEIERLDRAA